jgi:hypothetical protein
VKVYAQCGACGFETTDLKEAGKFEVHEVSEGIHVPFCKKCAETLELDAGK